VNDSGSDKRSDEGEQGGARARGSSRWPLAPLDGEGGARVAYIYNYVLGGATAWQGDVRAAAETIAAVPETSELFQQNRAFVARGARFLASEAGIVQFLDLGSGLTVTPSVHEIVRQIRAEAKVVYVDRQPEVIAQLKADLAPVGGVRAVQDDLVHPRRVLAHPDVRTLLDLSQPVGVILASVLHFLPAGEVRAALAELREALPGGSYVIVTHGTTDYLSPREIEGLKRAYSEASDPFPRSYREIRDFLRDWDLVPPGLVDASTWHADPPQYPTGRTLYYGAVAAVRPRAVRVPS
jgi:hypothetical protein